MLMKRWIDNKARSGPCEGFDLRETKLGHVFAGFAKGESAFLQAGRVSADQISSWMMQRTGMLRDFRVAAMAAFVLVAATGVAIAGLSGDRREDHPPQSHPKPHQTRQSNPPGQSKPPTAGGFDGNWSFTGTSTNCQGSGGGTFTVSGTRVFVSGGGRGQVSRSGAFQASTNAGGGVTLNAVGRLSGNRGSGSYQRSDGCAGRWTAVRR